MRKRHLLGISVAVSLVTAGGLAAADPFGDDGAAPTAIGSAGTFSVTLPTGDRVTRSPDGTVGFAPADGRGDAGYWRPEAGDGSNDLIVIPIDVADEIASGAQDPRRYNVSALLRAGYTDASAAPESALDDREYAGFAPAGAPMSTSAETRTVTVRISDHAGNVPKQSKVLWADLNHEDNWAPLEFDADGVATVDLAAGEYDLAVNLADEPAEGGRGETVSGIMSFSVGDEPVEVNVDGTTARPVSATVDAADAGLDAAVVDLTAPKSNLSTWEYVGGEYDNYVLPSESGGDDLTFVYAPILSGGADTDRPYTYNLNFGDPDGLPADLDFSVSDADLAAVDTHFSSLGIDTDGGFCESSFNPEVGTGYANCWVQQVSLPSDRTMFYNPDSIEYGAFSSVGPIGTGVIFDQVGASMTWPRGESDRTLNTAPLTAGFAYNGIARFSDGIATQFSLAANADPEIHAVGYDGYSGTVTLAAGDTEIGNYQGKFDEFPGGFDLPADADGRYTLHVTGSRDDGVTALGTGNDVSWTFDSPAADDEGVLLDASTVLLNVDGVVDGFADRDAANPVTVEYRQQPDGTDTTVRELTMQVSYDDGDTWVDVELDRDGDVATANLDYPADARFVSVRSHAVDDAGAELDQTTIRSYGLR